MHDVGEVNYNNHSHNNEGESEGAYMMESSALSTMYLAPEVCDVKQNNYAHAHNAAPAICKFLPMMDAGLAAAAQIYKVESGKNRGKHKTRANDNKTGEKRSSTWVISSAAIVKPAEVAQTAETKQSASCAAAFNRFLGHKQMRQKKNKHISQTEAGVEVYLLQQVRELHPGARFG